MRLKYCKKYACGATSHILSLQQQLFPQAEVVLVMGCARWPLSGCGSCCYAKDYRQYSDCCMASVNSRWHSLANSFVFPNFIVRLFNVLEVNDMRCSDCNKFVRNGELELEVSSWDVDSQVAVVEVRMVIPCGDCGTELAEVYSTDDIDLRGCTCSYEDSDIELEDPDVEPTEDFRPNVISKGKPVPARYRKHYYGARITVKGNCSSCGKEVAGQGSVEEQSSSFEQLY